MNSNVLRLYVAEAEFKKATNTNYNFLDYIWQFLSRLRIHF